MGLRVEIVPLAGYGDTAPFRIPIRCAYWSLRIQDGRVGQTVRGVPVAALGVANAGSANAEISIDFPPLFDANGRPVPWDDVLEFDPGGGVFIGSVILTYLDPA